MTQFGNISWNPLDIETYKLWAQAITDECFEELNEWEQGFITSIQEQLNQGRNLSERQAFKLESIYAEYTS